MCSTGPCVVSLRRVLRTDIKQGATERNNEATVCMLKVPAISRYNKLPFSFSY